MEKKSSPITVKKSLPNRNTRYKPNGWRQKDLKVNEKEDDSKLKKNTLTNRRRTEGSKVKKPENLPEDEGILTELHILCFLFDFIIYLILCTLP